LVLFSTFLVTIGRLVEITSSLTLGLTNKGFSPVEGTKIFVKKNINTIATAITDEGIR